MRILIIEDDNDLASIMKLNLEREFCSVDVANDGARGVFLARTNKYDLILADYILPQENGYEVVKQIRNEDKEVFIVMMTVRSELENKLEMFNLGVDDYITKPFLTEEMIARIKAVLRRPHQTLPQVRRVDDLLMDADKHLVKRGKDNIYLTRKEFALLEYFLRNKGRVLTRTAIMENVWDANADPFSNTIESHIVNLRRKINLPGKKPLIHSISGRGYKLDVRK
jgi:DNA-binding response OmpR family regulator